ncbi:methyltransferase (TIGR00027 family) [Variovorax beijingensis]|uniref:S-adenosyl-L-methionine-dependent methyltransferase n=2 Tax=Variovorax beijingensis TaxID=2496117 RepID=A0A561AZL4_9BURK|nr:methyltransferase (TIGR00027 family) [Variovorax beijingensis]
MRSLHARVDPLPLLQDPWGERLVPDSVRKAFARRALERLPEAERAAVATDLPGFTDSSLRAASSYTGVITRSRFTEDALHEAAACGVRQYVLVGAGFDSYALRPPAAGRDVRIYEVDHPATQSFKLRRLEEAGIARPAAARFLAADLANEDLGDVLARSDYDPLAPAFFSWLGVTMYLTRAANEQALRSIARCAAASSELTFTYIDALVFRPEAGVAYERFKRLRREVAAIGEPFLCGFDPATLPHELAALGFDLVNDLSDADLVSRYDPQGRNALRTVGHSRIALARVR